MFLRSIAGGRKETVEFEIQALSWTGKLGEEKEFEFLPNLDDAFEGGVRR